MREMDLEENDDCFSDCVGTKYSSQITSASLRYFDFIIFYEEISFCGPLSFCSATNIL